jgi:hypothetical protein
MLIRETRPHIFDRDLDDGLTVPMHHVTKEDGILNSSFHLVLSDCNSSLGQGEVSVSLRQDFVVWQLWPDCGLFFSGKLLQLVVQVDKTQGSSVSVQQKATEVKNPRKYRLTCPFDLSC